MMSNWKVRLEDWNALYVFTLAEALEYLCQNKDSSYSFKDMMIHNVVLRDALRSLGVKSVMDQIHEFAPDNEKLRSWCDTFVKKHPDGSIGDLDIQVYSIEEDVEILGHIFHGLDDIKAYVEMTLYENDRSKESARHGSPEKCGDVHVGEVRMSYPCFDSSDYDCENRSYQNYIVRKETISADELWKVKILPTSGNFKKINEQMPLDVLPMVYYSGEGGAMLVATLKSNNYEKML